jgi:hypothetical protein
MLDIKDRERFPEFLDAKGSVATDPNVAPGRRTVARANLVEYAGKIKDSNNLLLRSRKVVDKLTKYSLDARHVAIDQGDLTEDEAHYWLKEVNKHLIHIQANDL